MKIIILDRDGVINHDSINYIRTKDEFKPINGSLEAIANITKLNYTVVVATNQSGLGRGLFSQETLNEIHEKLHELVLDAGGKITAIFYCPHHPDKACTCRKPKPGMLIEIFNRFNVQNIKNVHLVGDSLRDLEAISEVGGIPVLVRTGNGDKTISKGNLPEGTLIFDNLLDFSLYLMDKESI